MPEPGTPLRPPATPLVTHHPYFSVWSFVDRLTDDTSRHWTGAQNGLVLLARIDGKAVRLGGQWPRETPELPQTGLEVTPTRTIYSYAGEGVAITLTFTSPLIPNDLELVSRPVSYVTWEARATDGRTHEIEVYLDLNANWAADTDGQQVAWGRYRVEGLDVVRVGTVQQPILDRSGDNLRIDWGYAYLAVPAGQGTTAMTHDGLARRTFVDAGVSPAADDLRCPRRVNDQWFALSAALSLGEVGDAPVERHVLLAYDDIFALEYMGRKVRPYWRRAGMEADELLQTAEREYPSVLDRCRAFDEELTADLTRRGGEKFAALCALAHRQCLSAHALAVDFDGTLLYMSKENFSNGCICTVDVTYPSAPFFLLFQPDLLRGMLTPILDYSQSSRWKFPFAPHDLGTYPLANGQVYGGGERTEDDQMPVEECGNMLILLAALAEAEGDTAYAERYWPTLTQWAEYLKDKGLDPENQLCTDDFAGHLAHNVNLSLKAIMGLGCYARLCEKTGRAEDAESYRRHAEQMAADWQRMADDGDHYRLAFDKPGSWSQKYNLVWDTLLGLNLFPKTVAEKEIAFYKTKQNAYGLPLDNRSEYTKLDWIVWTACLAEDPADFRALTDPLYTWMNETPTRVPLTDWYWTTDGKQVGFQARSVVGGLFLPLLFDGEIWKKWLGRVK